MELRSMKVFDSAHVSQHNNTRDCWVIINARVYDVTKFLNDHPGGDTVLLDVAGKNASEEFEAAGHGSAARLMLDEYYVGEQLQVDLLTPFHGKLSLKEGTHDLKQQEENKPSRLRFMMKSVGLLLPIAILLGGGGVIGFMWYK